MSRDDRIREMLHNEARVARFWSNVEKTKGCWIWNGSRGPDGYGGFGEFRAHRVSYMIAHGTIPAGLSICHTCDNPPCVRPSHLRAWTLQQNNADMVRKGRNVIVRGERCGASRLTEDTVRKIRAFTGRETTRKMGARFGCSETTVRDILHRRWWKHVT